MVKSASVGSNKINSWMKPFSKETKFNKERLTNHSAGKADKIAMSHITQLSDHRNVQRMTNCSRVNLEQQREVLNILNRIGCSTTFPNQCIAKCKSQNTRVHSSVYRDNKQWCGRWNASKII